MGEEEIIIGFFIISHLHTPPPPPSLTKPFPSIITTQKVSLFLNSSSKQQAVIHCPKTFFYSFTKQTVKPRGVLWISSDRDDGMGAKIKTPKNPTQK